MGNKQENNKRHNFKTSMEIARVLVEQAYEPIDPFERLRL